jgi:hypothetical protein
MRIGCLERGEEGFYLGWFHVGFCTGAFQRSRGNGWGFELTMGWTLTNFSRLGKLMAFA